MYIWGVLNYRKQGVHFWMSALLPIIIVSFIIGSRTWGADYYNYKRQFVNTLYATLYMDQQPFFLFINSLLRGLGFNYVGAFSFYTFIYLLGMFCFVHSFGASSKYMYAFILFSYIGFGTDIIRQAFAMGFVFFMLYYYEQRKWMLAFVFAIIAFFLHSVTIITMTMFVSFSFLLKNPLNIKYTIPIYLLLVFVYKPEYTAFLAPFLSSIHLGDSKFQGYLDDSDKWFSKNGANEIYTQGAGALILNTLFIIGLIYLGYQALKEKKNDRIAGIYNFVVVGYMMLRVFNNFEILRRIAIPMTLLWPIIMGYSIFILKKNKNTALMDRKSKKIMKISFFCIYLFLALYWGRFVFLSPEKMFYWQL